MTMSHKNLDKRSSTSSELKVIVPLASDSSSRLKLTDANGNIRVGRLLEIMDIIAPCSCYMHNRADMNDNWFSIGTLPRMFVTSRIHPIMFDESHKLSPYRNVYVHSKVTWTSDHQSEAHVSVIQNGVTFVTARIVFVSLNGNNLKEKCAVHQLSPTTRTHTVPYLADIY